MLVKTTKFAPLSSTNRSEYYVGISSEQYKDGCFRDQVRMRTYQLRHKIEVKNMVTNSDRVVPSPTEMTNTKYRVVQVAQYGLDPARRLQDYR
jgi:hypothetical protein